MQLAVVLNKYESEFICDVAEYYHIWHYETFSPGYLAILLSGLREGSRVYMARAGQKASTDQMILAKISDELSLMVHGKIENSLLGLLINGAPKDDKMCKSFKSKDSFNEWWNNH